MVPEVQVRRRSGGARTPPFDGFAAFWFTDRDADLGADASPQWQALDADGPNGFDMSVAMGGFVTEHIMRWDAAPDQRPYTAAD